MANAKRKRVLDAVWGGATMCVWCQCGVVVG